MTLEAKIRMPDGVAIPKECLREPQGRLDADDWIQTILPGFGLGVCVQG